MQSDTTNTGRLPPRRETNRGDTSAADTEAERVVLRVVGPVSEFLRLPELISDVTS